MNDIEVNSSFFLGICVFMKYCSLTTNKLEMGLFERQNIRNILRSSFLEIYSSDDWYLGKNVFFFSFLFITFVIWLGSEYIQLIQTFFSHFLVGGWSISDHGATIGSASFNPGWLIPAACWWASHVHYRYWKCRVSTTYFHFKFMHSVSLPPILNIHVSIKLANFRLICVINFSTI